VVILGSLKFNWNNVIQLCIALADVDKSNFNNIMKEIIKNSLFTERQIEIILNHKNLLDVKFEISRGAYFRQVNQSRNKLQSFYYSIILLRGLGIILPDDIDVISRLSEQITVMQNSDVFPEREQQIIDVIHKTIQKVVGM
jgi:hypothetical protein